MAISRNALLAIGLGTFATALMLASGPVGAAFGVALFSSLLVAAALTATVHFTPWSSFHLRPSIWPSHSLFGGFHRPLFSRHFSPAPSHSRTFFPGGVNKGYTPSYSAHRSAFTGGGFSAAPRPAAPSFGATHTRSFVPGGLRR